MAGVRYPFEVPEAIRSWVLRRVDAQLKFSYG